MTDAPRKRQGNYKAGPGRPPKLVVDKKMIDQVRTMAQYGMQVERIAAVLGISTRTFQEHVRRAKERFEAGKEPNADLNLYCALSKGRAAADLKVGETAYKMATDGKNPAMTIFLCKVRLGWKETVHLEHTGEDGGPIKVEDKRQALRALLQNPEAAAAAETVAAALEGTKGAS